MEILHAGEELPLISGQLGSTLESAEGELLLRTLASTNNNKTHAAEILGVTAKTLHNKLQRYTWEGPRAR